MTVQQKPLLKKRKTLSSILAGANKVLNDLRAIASLREQEVERNYQRISQLEKETSDLKAEQEKAERIANKIQELLS